jgi:outer membrane protein assembly factor BamB
MDTQPFLEIPGITPYNPAPFNQEVDIMNLSVRCRLFIPLFLFLTIGTAPHTFAADWPNWRGPDYNGISLETNWFKTGSTLETVWEAAVGQGYSSVAVVGEKLYTAGNKNNQDIVQCLNARSGTEVWKFSYPCSAGSYPGPRATPAVSDNRVYLISREGRVICLKADSGAEIWSRSVAHELKADLPGWGFAGSPRIQGNLLLLNVGEKGLALDKVTGATIWSSGTGKSGYSTPVVSEVGGRSIVALFSAQNVVGVDLKTGASHWQFPWKTSYDVNAADPLIEGGRMLISSGYGVGATLLKIDGEKPVVIWNNKALRSHFGTPVLWKGFVYGFDGNAGGGTLKCIDWATGTVKWEYAGFGFGSLTMADGKLIIQSERGELAIALASPDGYQELAKRAILKGTCWTVPILANGLIYCRNDAGRLLAISVSATPATP